MKSNLALFETAAAMDVKSGKQHFGKVVTANVSPVKGPVANHDPMESHRFTMQLPTAIAIVSVACSSPAHAQRIEENAIADANDAFGMTLGSERTGLYGNDDVRGFSPVDAGNTRIEGLYFDQVDRLSQRLLHSSTIRVGISAQNYPFAAPTGIADYHLHSAEGPLAGSLDLEFGEFGGLRGSIDARLPLVADSLGLALSLGRRHQVKAGGETAELTSFGAIATWRPGQSSRVTVFTGGIDSSDEDARPSLFMNGDVLPPRIERGRFLGQSWTDRSYAIRSSGVITQVPLGQFQLEGGLFNSRRKTFKTFTDILSGVEADGRAASRAIIADGNNLEDAWSGELRVSRTWRSAKVRQRLTVSFRGRDKLRLFGGSQRIALGPSNAGLVDERPEPVIALGPEDKDKVRQFALGASYGFTLRGRGSIEASVAKISYRKKVDFFAPARPDVETRDNPIVWNVSGSVRLSRSLAIYAGYSTGLEEALIAPEIAINRSESPPAIRTRQIDAGLRFAITPKLKLVAGLFSIRKPYFNLDQAQRYGELGTVESRGIELSFAGQLLPGLSTVLGTVLMDPAISGDAVTSGQIGPRPIGSIRRRSIANIDWRLAGGTSPLSFDLAFESLSSRPVNARNSLRVPGRSTFNLGGRYRFALASKSALARLQVSNAFNSYGWNVSSSGGMTYSDGRTFNFQVIVEY